MQESTRVHGQKFPSPPNWRHDIIKSPQAAKPEQSNWLPVLSSAQFAESASFLSCESRRWCVGRLKFGDKKAPGLNNEGGASSLSSSSFLPHVTHLCHDSDEGRPGEQKGETSNSPSAAAARIIMLGTKREREVGDLDLIARVTSARIREEGTLNYTACSL